MSAEKKSSGEKEQLEKDFARLDLENDLNSWVFSASEVTLETKIGKGSFGVVYKAKLRGKEVAVKKLFTTSSMDEKSLDAFKKEANLLRQLRHPNLLLALGVVIEPGNFLLVTELMTRGSVYDILHEEESPDQLTFKRCMKMAKDAAMGLNWLHKSTPSIIHRDLKTGNLLVDRNWNVKVSDFGLSHTKKNQQGVRGNYGAIGTPLWMAPEVLLNKEYNETSDVYSFGIVLWELLTREDPFEDIENIDDMLAAVCHRHERPPIPAQCPPTLSKLIQSCWSPNPEDRPSFDTMIKNQLFDKITVEAIINDENGRKFWEKFFLGEDTVDWPNFSKKFCTFWNIPISEVRSLKFRCLQAVLFEGSDEPVVTIERFSKVLSWFGPMESGTAFLDRIEDLLKQPYFHGSLEASSAEKLLVTKPVGTFLVRFSARDPGCYAISAVGEGFKVKHYRIYHKPGESFVIGKTEVPSIQEIIHRYGSTDLGLEIACPGNPFGHLFSKPFSRDISEGYKTVILS